ncbi:MAG: hypothetical protein ACM3SM_07600 [Bacteroidota bacterium]
MKKIALFVVLMTAVTFGQLKDQLKNSPRISDGIIKNNTPSMVLGFFNPNNFSMHHSYSLSYSAFGNNSLAMGVYTNSMAYKFSDKLNVQLDASLVHSPYNTLGNDFTNQINGVYISKAALNYQPWENFKINIQYRNSPYNYYSPYSGYYSPFYGADSWFEDFDR